MRLYLSDAKVFLRVLGSWSRHLEHELQEDNQLFDPPLTHELTGENHLVKVVEDTGDSSLILRMDVLGDVPDWFDAGLRQLLGEYAVQPAGVRPPLISPERGRGSSVGRQECLRPPSPNRILGATRLAP